MTSNNKSKFVNLGALAIVAAILFVGYSTWKSHGSGSLLSSQPDDVVVEDITLGSGAVAEKGQIAVVKYTTYLKDGMKKIDSSLDRNSDFHFRLGAGQVVQGWDKGVQGMRVGGKRRITVPSKLGYGEKGAGQIVPPNSVLVYETELAQVEEYKVPEMPAAKKDAVKKSTVVPTPAHKK